MAQRGGLALAAGSAAVMLLGAPAFTSGPTTSGGIIPERSVGAASGPATQGRSAFSSASVAVCAAGALSLGAMAGRSRRAGQVARNSLLTTDDQGRYRFGVPEKPLVIQEQPGVTAPLGFFDPLGFAKSGLMTFQGDPTGFKHLREAEIKHGRVAMMGSVGSAFAHYVKFPGFEGVKTGLAALDNDVGSKGFAVLFVLVGLIEAANWKPKNLEPGSYGDPFNFGNYSMESRTRELNNGRMAMFAMMGQLVAELQTGTDPIQQFGLD